MRYSNIETSLAMSTLATWSHVFQSRDVSPHNFDGLAMSGLAFSVAPNRPVCVRQMRSVNQPSIMASSFHSSSLFCLYLSSIQDGPKMAQNFYMPITSSNINRFSKFFHCQYQQKNLWYNAKDLTSHHSCRYSTL